MSNTGFKAYTNLEQYYLDSGVATGFKFKSSSSNISGSITVYGLAKS